KRHVSSGYTATRRVMCASWLLFFLPTQAPDPLTLLLKTASACVAAHNKVSIFNIYLKGLS
ncbi:MAG: hypothetical protein Q8L69_08130, partial [Gallionellaceae bacterium]|nr:hypothetical protein [Gallionellaceae bacterium]